jgi:hypothetical protein
MALAVQGCVFWRFVLLVLLAFLHLGTDVPAKSATSYLSMATPSLQRLSGNAQRCQRHYMRAASTAEKLLGESVPVPLDQKRDLAERSKACYDDLEKLYNHFGQCFQSLSTAIDKGGIEPDEGMEQQYETLADFSLDAPRTMNALRARITRLDEEIHIDVAASVSSSPVFPSHPNFPPDFEFQTARHRPISQGQGYDYSPTDMGVKGGIDAKVRVDDQRTSTPMMNQDCSGDTVTGGKPNPPQNQTQPNLPLNDPDPNTAATAGSNESISSVPAQVGGEGDSNVSVSQLVTMLAEAFNRGSSGNESRQRVSNIRCPKLELPKYDGKYADFHAWWDKFERIIDQNPSFNGSEKLSYLSASLVGKAAMLVKNLKTTNENYDVAVQMLKQAFGNPTIAVESIQSQLYDIKPVQRYDICKLKEFYFEVESCIGSLTSLGADTSSFVGLLLKKLPVAIVTSMERVKGTGVDWTMDLFRAKLREEIDLRETAIRRATGKDPTSREEPKRQWKETWRQHATTESFASADNKPDSKQKQDKPRGASHKQQTTWMPSSRAEHTSPKDPPSECVYCGKSHWCSDCPNIRTSSERRQRLARDKKCFMCLQKGHDIRNCTIRKRCYYCGQFRAHHQSICPEKYGDATDQANVADSDPKQCTDLTFKEERSGLADDERAVMKTAFITVENPKDPTKSIVIRGFFDTGTSRSFFTERAAESLDLEVATQRVLSISTFGPDSPLIDVVKTTPLILRNKSGEGWRINIAISKNTMKKMTKMAIPSQIRQRIPTGIELADDTLPAHTVVDVDFMIGNDYYEDMMTGRRIALGDGFWLVESVFGWMPSGRIPEESGQIERPLQVTSNLVLTELLTTNGEVARLQTECPGSIEDLWRLDLIGINDEPSPVTDDLAIEAFNKTVEFSDGRYQVTWPWQPNVHELPTNYMLALRRLHSLLSRQKALNRWDFLEKYDKIMKDQLDKGVIEEVPEDSGQGQRTHYLAHHGVETPQKTTTKLRVVYDASARAGPDKPSLNDCMYRGHVFLENILTLLLRFRCWPVAILADIEKAFLQVGLQHQERDVTRLLWVRNLRKPPDKENLVTYRFCRVPFGVKSSPFLLGATVSHHLKLQRSPTADSIAQNTYVDNVVLGVNTVEDGIQFYRKSKAIFQEAGMNLREYASNSAELMQQIAEKDRVGDNEVTVLGLRWDRNEDVFHLKVPGQDEAPVTKRTVLSQLFKVFDPLGFGAAVTIRGKILLQKITRSHLKWHEPLPDEFLKPWTELSKDLRALGNLSIPRYVGLQDARPSKIVAFSDASKAAYAVVVYVQYEKSDGQCQTRLAMSKARVAPIKEMSVPRLELMAMLIAVRAVEFVRNALRFNGQSVILCDSMCVLLWIKATKIQSTFVQNRVREIQRAERLQFRYVPSKENVADMASRGVPIDSLNDVWWYGPPWVSLTEDHWPSQGELDEATGVNWSAQSVEDEAAAAASCSAKTVNAADATVLQESVIGIKPDDVSSFNRLVRVTAWCLRFIDGLRKLRAAKASGGDKDQEKVTGKTETQGQAHKYLQPEEVKQATFKWVRACQQANFVDVIRQIRTNGNHSLVKGLGVKEDDRGLLRCHGRLANIEANESTKFPVLLPTKSRITQLIIEECHRKSFHAGTAQTLAALRREYWVPKGRARVSAVIRRCKICRKIGAGCFARPPMPDLPTVRVTRQHAFENVGLDNFGPIYVKVEGGPEKRWVTMFTCLTVRAVHLELVGDQSAQEFVLAVRRFMARYGNHSQSYVTTPLNSRQSAAPICSTISCREKKSVGTSFPNWHHGQVEYTNA